MRAYYYAREAGGKVLATYETTPAGIVALTHGCYAAYYYLDLEEWYIYGSESDGRISTLKPYPNEFTDHLQVNAIHFADQAQPNAMKDTLLYYGPTIIGSYQSNARITGYREYEIKDHLGNVRAVISDIKNPMEINLPINDWTFKADIRNLSNYYPYGMQLPKGTYSATDDYSYGYNGMEKDDELRESLYSTLFREGDTENGRWWSRDPLEMKYTSFSPYSTMGNNPITMIDPFGDDYVKHEDGSIVWDNEANDLNSTPEGSTYLGKDLNFKFTSYIDEKLWDGPLGSVPAGEKLISTINLKASENEKGELIGLTAKMETNPGKTPVGKPKDFFEGLDENQNKYYANKTVNEGGEMINFSIIFEQHASVSEIEEFGLKVLGYDIVNVAQRLEITQQSNILSIKAATDIFPSATLTVNNFKIMQYNQPSFKNTHGVQKIQIGVKIPRNILDDGLIPIYEYRHLRPKPSLIYHLK